MTDYATACLLSYNRPNFIRTAISTLREHAGAPLELIVHDDGSHHPQVRSLLAQLVDDGIISTLIANPPGHNQGQGTALNRMFSMATGDPIIKLDQDLVFQPDWLSKANGILSVGQDARGQAGVKLGLLGLFHYHADPVDSAKTIIADHGAWQEHTHICGSGFAVTRQCWEELGPFSEHSEAFAEDWEFQKAVTDSPLWACGLPPQDLVLNQGFGVGPSTVVVDHDHTIQTINKVPVIHRG